MRRLAEAMRDPASTAGLDAAGWSGLITAARAEQMIGSLAHRLEGQAMPPAAARILEDARASAAQWRQAALWEAEMARRALAPLGIPVVLMKGTAYVAAGLDAGIGRSIGDLDIMVAREALDAAEQALLAAGWEWVKPDPYDDAYYRDHMHELPPLIHRERDRMIDVHHTILPLTARQTPDAGGMLSAAIPLPSNSVRPEPFDDACGVAQDKLRPVGRSRGTLVPAPRVSTALDTNGMGGAGPGPGTSEGLLIFSPEDMFLHGVAHLFADGDLAGGLRNLWDQDRLLRQFAPVAGFWARLGDRARHHQLAPHLALALRLARAVYGTPVDPALAGRWRWSDALYLRRLTVRDGWGRQRRPVTRLAFYVRSHWLRMPPAMLARHLWTKWRKG